mmetsp:Transcript_139203/g.242272  ORF Transcript_139203/g.242272 Transcript_139203/m.242272 type:complete len:659 (-) Transcript_139203:132-2108(-)
MMHWVFKFLTLAALPLLAALSIEEAKQSPLSKVVTLLEDMRAQLVTEREQDDDLFQKLSCFCQTKKKTLTEAILTGGTKSSQLKADIQEGSAKMSTLIETLKQAKAEFASNQDSLTTQTELNEKETADNLAEQKTTKEAIAALTAALEKLQAKGASLAEVRSAAKDLRDAQIMSLEVMGGHETVALKAFLREAEDLKPSFLQSGGPFKSYGSQTGQVVGILSQMKEDFEKHLDNLISEAAKSKSEFDSFSTAKKAEIDSNMKQISKLTKDSADTKSRLVQDADDLDDTEKMVANSRKDLALHEKTCADETADYETRTTGRLEEMKAVEETIQLLDSDDTFALGSKTLDFLQTATSVSAGHREQMKRRRAAQLLQRTAAKTDAPWLALMASKLMASPFAEVTKEIKKMIVELSKQQEDELVSKTECDTDLKSNSDDLDDTQMDLGHTTEQLNTLKHQLENLETQLKTAKGELAENEQQMAAMTKHHEEEIANFKQFTFDQTAMIDILTKAMQRLSAVYSLVQSQNEAEQGGGQRKSGRAVVINMLKQIKLDAESNLHEETKEMQKSEMEYRTILQHMESSMQEAQKTIYEAKGTKALIKQDLAREEKELSTLQAKKTSLVEIEKDLHEECDWLLKNFDLRQASRLKEIDAMKDAIDILA